MLLLLAVAKKWKSQTISTWSSISLPLVFSPFRILLIRNGFCSPQKPFSVFLLFCHSMLHKRSETYSTAIFLLIQPQSQSFPFPLFHCTVSVYIRMPQASPLASSSVKIRAISGQPQSRSFPFSPDSICSASPLSGLGAYLPLFR